MGNKKERGLKFLIPGGLCVHHHRLSFLAGLGCRDHRVEGVARFFRGVLVLVSLLATAAGTGFSLAGTLAHDSGGGRRW